MTLEELSALEKIKQLKIDKESIEAMLSANAMKLIGI